MAIYSSTMLDRIPQHIKQMERSKQIGITESVKISVRGLSYAGTPPNTLDRFISETSRQKPIYHIRQHFY